MIEPAINSGAQTTETRVIVSISPLHQAGGQRATISESAESAQRLVEALVEAGCDPARVRAFSGHEVVVAIESNPSVALYDCDGRILASAVSEVAAPRLPEPVFAPSQPAPSPHSAPLPPSEGSFHLRVDRIVFAALWALSLVVLLVSLIASLSRSEPREFVPGDPDTGAASPSPATRALGQLISPIPHMDVSVSGCFASGVNDCHCADFATQEDAQWFFSQHPPGAGHVVDTDGDGVVCEWLPSATPAP